jgi:hypothetical protein
MESNGTAAINGLQEQLPETVPQEPVKTPPKRVRKYPPKQESFRITFHINGNDYSVTPIDCHPEMGSKAYRLRKKNGPRAGAVYDVLLTPSGPTCDCDGYTKHGMCKHGKGCIHIRCLKAAGMISWQEVLLGKG